MREDIVEQFVASLDIHQCLDALKKTQNTVLEMIYASGVEIPSGFDTMSETGNFATKSIDPIIIRYSRSVAEIQPCWMSHDCLIPFQLKQSIIHLIKCRNALQSLSSLNDDEGVFHILAMIHEKYHENRH